MDFAGYSKIFASNKMTGRRGATVIEEHDLIQKILGGDSQAFQPLVERYNHLVYTAILKIVRDPNVAEDIAQEAFWQAYRSLDNFRGESGFSTWLTRIAVNKALDHCRRQRNVPQVQELGEDIPGPDDPQTEILKKEELWLVREEIQNLPAVYRKVILDYYFNDMSYREIAHQDRVAVKTIESRIYRAKALLRNSGIGGDEGGKVSAP